MISEFGFEPLNPGDYRQIVLFTGAGMSAECGVPTYRGKGGIWDKYNWEEVACQQAFERNPEKVLDFHEKRRCAVLECQPHRGHYVLADLEQRFPKTTIVTQNIDGLHQRAGSKRVIELHGSLWRLRCPQEGTVITDTGRKYRTRKCTCGAWLRPDIIWFKDYLNDSVLEEATGLTRKADLFISIGTSGVVWPAAGFPRLARENGAALMEINTEGTEMSALYDHCLTGAAGQILPYLFTLD